MDAFADRFLATGRPMHLLINDAGIMAIPLRRDARGLESQLAANHLGHFQLTLRLWPALKKTKDARVVTLSSGAHRNSAFNFDDPNFEHRAYDKWRAYGQSKTANILFTLELDRRASKHGVRAFAVHPGRIATDLQRSIPLVELQELGFRDQHGNIPEDQLKLYKTVEQGTATSVWCATSPALNGMGGVYCENVDIAEAVPADHKEPNGVMPWAIDSGAAHRLWELSEVLTSTTVDELASPIANRQRQSR
jgi:NAD(P)-dependent dehydrogenase (short-subunit alcohol dehydrogenase family)